MEFKTALKIKWTLSTIKPIDKGLIRMEPDHLLWIIYGIYGKMCNLFISNIVYLI